MNILKCMHSREIWNVSYFYNFLNYLLRKIILGPLAHNSLVGLTSSTMFLYLVVALCWAVVLGFIYFGMPETHAEEHHELPNPSVGKVCHMRYLC